MLRWGECQTEHRHVQQINRDHCHDGHRYWQEFVPRRRPDRRGAIVLRQKWSRGQIETRLAAMAPCLIGMEACVGAHRSRSPTSSPVSPGRFSTRSATSKSLGQLFLRPNLRKRGTVLGTVKAWPANAGARTEATATASLDGPCARCPAQRAGRDEGTASRHEQRNCTDQERAMSKCADTPTFSCLR